MKIIPVHPDDVRDVERTTRRTFGHRRPTRRTFGRRPVPTRRTFAMRRPTRRTFARTRLS